MKVVQIVAIRCPEPLIERGKYLARFKNNLPGLGEWPSHAISDSITVAVH